MTYKYDDRMDEVLHAYWAYVQTVEDPVAFTNEVIYHLKSIKNGFKEEAENE